MALTSQYSRSSEGIFLIKGRHTDDIDAMRQAGQWGRQFFTHLSFKSTGIQFSARLSGGGFWAKL